eukprot:3101840-Ditylum_brightwellii.AAC.1
MFQTSPECQFINDVAADRFQMAEMKNKQVKTNEVILNSSQQDALKLVMGISLTEGDDQFPLPESGAQRIQDVDVDSANKDEQITTSAGNKHDTSYGILLENESSNVADFEMQAIISVKNANYLDLEEMLDIEGVPVDTSDEHGNTLLIIACQQGNKKMA